MIKQPDWKSSPDGTFHDKSGNVMSNIKHPPYAFKLGVEYGAKELANHLIELARQSSEAMYRELIAIADGRKSVTKDWK